ncbi:hypothetical protein Tco_0681767 [Tanacetum coccineum]|uniref:Auxilin-like protein n=1 Tax=Tanacetum coccineum TaxID=301880 RepID=A0ABQ4XR78_9ASTR
MVHGTDVGQTARFVSSVSTPAAASVNNVGGRVADTRISASRTQSWVLQDHILRDSGICGMDDDYGSALACLHDTIPSFILAVKLIRTPPPLKRAGISTKKEAHVNFLIDPSDGRFALRPADVLVFGWVGGKYVYLDLTGVSPLVGLSSRGFIAGQAALKDASCKVTKHEKACIKNQHVFIPFAFDTFGFLAPEATELLNRVQRVMHNNVMTPRSTDVVFKRIGFAIQKGLAAQLVARLPSTTM